MPNNFDKILDECIERINQGEDIDPILGDYPDYTEQLRPLLNTVLSAKEVYSFIPSPDRKRAARERYNSAVEALERKREERQRWFTWFPKRSRVWAPAVIAILLIIAGYFVLRPTLFPSGPITESELNGATVDTQPDEDIVSPDIEPDAEPAAIVLQPSQEGNFAFLISDDVNAIGDFESVVITISEVTLIKSNDEEQSIKFKPVQEEVDLTLVQGDRTQEIWRGDVPEGEYKNVTIEVEKVSGVLEETGGDIEIKLPSQKLHVSKRFQVNADGFTTFTYDLTVISTGSPQSGEKYILKPQVDQSRAEQKPIESKGEGKKEGPNGKK
jgi:hypothetical protein